MNGLPFIRGIDPLDAKAAARVALKTAQASAKTFVDCALEYVAART
jgi:hypothetical protein